ncbi:MAG: hypothetical protein U0Y68_10945 [Blastocatellia bacterium]
MRYIQIRLFALAVMLAAGGLTYYNWYRLEHEGRYSLKLAAFGPVCIIGGLFLLFFPTYIGKPETTREKVVVMTVFGLGLAIGLGNLFLMDPQMFGW